MKNKKSILKEAIVLLVIVIMICSTVAVATNTMKTVTEIEKIAPLNRGILFEDDFESYEDFVIDFPPWINIDVDGAETFSHSSIVWPNDTDPKAFIIFNPSATTPPWDDANMYTHSGDKFAACFNANNAGYISDDWLVTPLLGPANYDEVSFWAKSYNNQYNLERFEVGISTTDPEPSEFTIISESPYITVPYEAYTQYTYNLDEYDNQAIYIGIHCISVDSWLLMVDDFSLAGATIIADAGGPYEAYEGKDIQFAGSVTGGTPPYTYKWDFGNGDTSNLEDPIYAYDEPGVYTVTLTITDSTQTSAIDTATATILESPCCFDVTIPAGFSFGLKADVTETCSEDHTAVPWEFDISGGLFFIPISKTEGISDFSAGETKTIKVPLVLGLGNIKISFTISEDCDPITVDALALGPFIITK